MVMEVAALLIQVTPAAASQSVLITSVLVVACWWLDLAVVEGDIYSCSHRRRFRWSMP
jgi:hypothetical protein